VKGGLETLCDNAAFYPISDSWLKSFVQSCFEAALLTESV